MKVSLVKNMLSTLAFGVLTVVADTTNKTPGKKKADFLETQSKVLLDATGICAKKHVDFVTANGPEPDDPKEHRQNMTGCVSTGLFAMYNNISDLKGKAAQMRLSSNVRIGPQESEVGCAQEDNQDEAISADCLVSNFHAWLDAADWDDFRTAKTLMNLEEFLAFVQLLQNPPPRVEDITNQAEVQAAFQQFFFHLDEMWATILRLWWKELEPQILRSRTAAWDDDTSLQPHSFQ